MSNWEELNAGIVRCERCPRLRDHCRDVAHVKRRAFQDCEYWGQPVPNFGDATARLLIVGLAPAAHGANRTGRMFTGDRSGDWLYRALHRSGFATQAESSSRHDGLQLRDCAITAACNCAPPGNRPTRDELEACQNWLQQTVHALPVRVILALGQIAWRATVELVRLQGWSEGPIPRFGHGAVVDLPGPRSLVGSYHPSQQNTFTGRLTETMLDDVFRTIRGLL